MAFTNLFSLLETGFFQPRVRTEVLSQLAVAASAVGAYHDRNLERFRVAADSTGASDALLASPAEDLRALDQAVVDLQGQVAALTNVRIVEAGKNLIHYSRLPSDVREATTERTAYKRLAEADDTVPAELLGGGGDAGTLLIDGSRNRFIYILPVGGGGATALFYVDALGLSTELLRAVAPVGKGVSTLADVGVLVDASTAERDAIRRRPAQGHPQRRGRRRRRSTCRSPWTSPREGRQASAAGTTRRSPSPPPGPAAAPGAWWCASSPGPPSR